MFSKIFKIIICTLILGSFFFATDSESHIRMYVTSDVKSETEPCGWKKKPSGGLARKCTVVKNSKAEGFSTLVFDAGNLFFKKDRVDPGIEMDKAKENAKAIVSSFNHITCQAFSPGKKDFAAGVDFLKELQASSDFDYISCNIKGKDAQLLFEPYKIIDIENLSLGIIGASSSFVSDDVLVDDPYVSINSVLSEIRDDCDYVILLFSSSSSDYKKLSDSDLELDLVIRGNTNRHSHDGGKNKFPIYTVGDRGKLLYQFDLKHNIKSSPLVDVAYFEKLIRNDSKKLNQLVVDTSQVNNERVAQYRENIQKYSEIINSIENSLQFKKVTLNQFIQDDPHVLKIVDEAKLKVNSLGTPVFDPEGNRIESLEKVPNNY